MSSLSENAAARLEGRPRLFKAARGGFRVLQRTTLPLRRSYYLNGGATGIVRVLPSTARAAVGLDDPSAIGSRKIEVGGGPHALPGHIHVDIDPGAHHLEAIAPAWELPFDDGWGESITAIHALEHVHPTKLVDTLTEWHRVLRPGGTVRVHVPNGPELMEAFVKAPVGEKWPIMGSLLGMYCGPDSRDPRKLDWRSDHQMIFDFPLLEWALREGGFSDVRDLSAAEPDRHSEGWSAVVPHYSLIAEAVKPG